MQSTREIYYSSKSKEPTMISINVHPRNCSYFLMFSYIEHFTIELQYMHRRQRNHVPCVNVLKTTELGNVTILHGHFCMRLSLYIESLTS